MERVPTLPLNLSTVPQRRCLTFSSLSHLCIFLFHSSKHTRLSQVQPFSLPNRLLRPRWLPKSAPHKTRPFLHHNYMKTVHVVQCGDYLYIFTESQFLAFCASNEHPSVTTVCACVCLRERLCLKSGGVIEWRLAGLVWFSRWRIGASVAAAQCQLLQDSYTCKIYYILTKTLKRCSAVFVWQCGGSLKWFEGNGISNCSLKRDHSGKATAIMGLLFLSLYEAITISMLASYVEWLPFGLNYRMGFVGKSLISVQCSSL